MIRDSFTSAVAVTPADGSDLAKKPCLGLLANVAGTVAVRMKGSSTSVTLSLVAGVILRVRADRVLATGTTATGISALY